ncbi:MAG: LptF/LptG family permease [Bacteroidales bacterium]|nr:LptF/LptG family permease [Bacteroidales bacterium]
MIHPWYPKKLDWYIIKRFLTTFVVAMALIIVIVIIFDLSEKIEKFVEHEAPVNEIIFKYYLNFIPYFINMFSPLFIFITVIFFTSKMASNSEIVAILSCGISFHRMMVPYLISSAALAGLSLLLNLWIIPYSNSVRVPWEMEYVKGGYQNSDRNIHYQISPGEFLYLESFSTWNNSGHNFTLEKIENGDLVSKLTAETAVWDSTKSSWRLKKYFIRDYTDPLDDSIISGRQLDTVINLSIQDFYTTKKTLPTLSQRKLVSLIDTQKMRGDAKLSDSLVEYHNRFSLPFSAFILTIMGVALSSKKKRGGIGWNLVIGIALSFSYILFMKFSEMFVATGTLPPWIAVWLPNVIYTFIAAFLYKIAPK